MYICIHLGLMSNTLKLIYILNDTPPTYLTHHLFLLFDIAPALLPVPGIFFSTLLSFPTSHIHMALFAYNKCEPFAYRVSKWDKIYVDACATRLLLLPFCASITHVFPIIPFAQYTN